MRLLPTRELCRMQLAFGPVRLGSVKLKIQKRRGAKVRVCQKGCVKLCKVNMRTSIGAIN